MERRAIRDRVSIERQQVVRDLMLKGDLSAWLDQRLDDLQHCQVRHMPSIFWFWKFVCHFGVRKVAILKPGDSISLQISFKFYF
jgi:hypothetical protein